MGMASRWVMSMGGGDQDVVIGTNRETDETWVYLNDGRAGFDPLKGAFESNVGFSVDLVDVDSDGDLDEDGDLDLVLTDYRKPCQIWVNDGSGIFAESDLRFADELFYRHALLADHDGDGDLDIFLATFWISSGPNEIWFIQLN